MSCLGAQKLLSFQVLDFQQPVITLSSRTDSNFHKNIWGAINAMLSLRNVVSIYFSTSQGVRRSHGREDNGRT